MLRSAAHLVGRTPSFTIYDQDDSLGVMKRLMERHDISPKQFTPRGVQSAISDAKNALVAPAEYRAARDGSVLEGRRLVYTSLGEALQLANAVDFDDLLRAARSHAAAASGEAREYRERFRTSSSTSIRTRTARSTS